MDIAVLQTRVGARRLTSLAAAVWLMWLTVASAASDPVSERRGGGAEDMVRPQLQASPQTKLRVKSQTKPQAKSQVKPRTKSQVKPRAARSRTGAARRTGLNAKVVAHTDSARLRDLIHFLAPRGWRVRFDVAAQKLDQALVFHAETTRRRALDQLCSSLGLKGIFYPRKRLVLIVEGRAP